MDKKFQQEVALVLVSVLIGSIVSLGSIYFADQLHKESVEAELVIVGLQVEQVEKLNEIPFENLQLQLDITIPESIPKYIDLSDMGMFRLRDQISVTNSAYSKYPLVIHSVVVGYENEKDG